jgi:hypothetical protein
MTFRSSGSSFARFHWVVWEAKLTEVVQISCHLANYIPGVRRNEWTIRLDMLLQILARGGLMDACQSDNR